MARQGGKKGTINSEKETNVDSGELRTAAKTVRKKNPGEKGEVPVLLISKSARVRGMGKKGADTGEGRKVGTKKSIVVRNHFIRAGRRYVTGRRQGLRGGGGFRQEGRLVGRV